MHQKTLQNIQCFVIKCIMCILCVYVFVCYCVYDQSVIRFIIASSRKQRQLQEGQGEKNKKDQTEVKTSEARANYPKKIHFPPGSPKKRIIGSPRKRVTTKDIGKINR